MQTTPTEFSKAEQLFLGQGFANSLINLRKQGIFANLSKNQRINDELVYIDVANLLFSMATCNIGTNTVEGIMKSYVDNLFALLNLQGDKNAYAKNVLDKSKIYLDKYDANMFSDKSRITNTSIEIAELFSKNIGIAQPDNLPILASSSFIFLGQLTSNIELFQNLKKSKEKETNRAGCSLPILCLVFILCIAAIIFKAIFYNS